MGLTVCTLVRNRNVLLSRLVQGLVQGHQQPSSLVVAHAGGEDPRPVLAGLPFDTVVLPVGDGGERIPYSAARNAAARAARSANVVFLDADTIPTPTMVGAYDAALDQHDALCIGEVLYLPPDAVSDGWTTESLRAVGRPHPARPTPPAQGATRSEDYAMVWGLSVALRRSTLLDTLGGFDEDYLGYAGEDTDLAETARRAGVPLLVVADAGVFHHHHESWEPPVQQLRATVANCRVFHRKHGWWPMGGWLAQFAALGLIEWTPESDDVRVLREADPAQIAAAHRRVARPFR